MDFFGLFTPELLTVLYRASMDFIPFRVLEGAIILVMDIPLSRFSFRFLCTATGLSGSKVHVELVKSLHLFYFSYLKLKKIAKS